MDLGWITGPYAALALCVGLIIPGLVWFIRYTLADNKELRSDAKLAFREGIALDKESTEQLRVINTALETIQHGQLKILEVIEAEMKHAQAERKILAKLVRSNSGEGGG